jgi:TetR/AcrR family transcriptional repressor of nem operon
MTCSASEPIRRSTVPRPRKFDEDRALDAAIERFWEQGYAGTTIRDLSADMGMTGASLYNAFGDKRALFCLALRRYVAGHSLAAVAAIAASDNPILSLDRFLKGLVREAAATGRGCLLISSAAEVPSGDPSLQEEINDHLLSVEKALRASLVAARRKSLVPVSLDCTKQARVVLSAIISIQILARRRTNSKVLAAIAQSAMPEGPKSAA